MRMKILIVCLSFLELCTNLVSALDPPFVDSSYRAIGEIILDYDPGDTVVISFEENFDFDNRKAVFTANAAGFATTLFEDMDLNQTFKYDDYFQDEKYVQKCQLYDSGDWTKVHLPPDLEAFEKERTYFPMMQLLWGLTRYNKKPGTNETVKFYRDIPCYMWLYQITYSTDQIDYNVEIEAYWSNGEWNTSSKENVVPVGFIIHHNGVNKTSGQPIKMDQYVNVMHFTQDYFNKEAFLPRQGVYCPGRKSLKTFPPLPKFTGVFINIEFQWQKYQVDSNVDISIDPTSKLAVVHYDPSNQPVNIFIDRKRKIASSLICSWEENIAYDIREDTCRVIWTSEIENEVQTLYDIEQLSKLTIESFLGKNVNYVYIGEAVKRGIPCRLWQGQRRGWPSDEPSITTVWEWCIAERVDNPIVLQENAVPIISLDITVTESHLTTAGGAYTLGTKFSYQFYLLEVRKPSYMKMLDFDISPCFNDSYKEWLQFDVDVKSDRKFLKNATANPDFIDEWRVVLYGVTGIRPNSLRVQKIRAILTDTVLIVQFVLLDRHPDTPTNVPADANLSLAKHRLAVAIDGDAVSIDWQNIILKASKGSLKTVFEITDPTNTTQSPPVPTTTTTTTKITDKETKSENTERTRTKSEETTLSITSDINTTPSKDGGDTTTTQQTTTDGAIDQQKERSMEGRHSGGAMAGLGIGMLILGFSLGAGGTFAKYRYFPSLW